MCNLPVEGSRKLVTLSQYFKPESVQKLIMNNPCFASNIFKTKIIANDYIIGRFIRGNFSLGFKT